MSDFSGFQVKKCGGETTIIGMTQDGRQVSLSVDEFNEITGGIYGDML